VLGKKKLKIGAFLAWIWEFEKSVDFFFFLKFGNFGVDDSIGRGTGS
jgi:hypothetical protein